MSSKIEVSKGVWQKIDEEYTVSAVRENNDWKIFLTNLVGIWTEKLSTETIIERCKTLNPLLKINAMNVDEIMEQIFEDIPTHAVEKSVNCITLHKSIQGGIFKFKIGLSKGSDEDFFERVTKSLCLSSVELFRRNSILLELIKKKDEEIAEYKAVGAKLIRKNIETKPFTKEGFNIEKIKEVNPLNAFQSVVGVYNETRKLNSQKEAMCSKNLKSPIESGNLNIKELIPTSSTSKKLRQEEKRRKAKKGKSAISASFVKPAVKKVTRGTNFIS